MIYLLEDDESIRNFIVYALNNMNMEARGFERPSEFWEALRSEMPQLLLLDIMLPEQDGIEILKRYAGTGKRAAAGHHAHGQGNGIRQGTGS